MGYVVQKTDGREVTYLSCAETAKLVREALRRAFADVKFGVRSKTYSGGASIDIGWKAGPGEKEVKAVVRQFEGSYFDGMIDLKQPFTSWLLPDGTAITAKDYGTIGSMGVYSPRENPRPEGAKEVHFGADFIFCNREAS